MIKLTCKFCAKSYDAYPCQRERQFCSKACRLVAHAAAVKKYETRTCVRCAAIFSRLASELSRSPSRGKFCSVACHKKRTGGQRVCEICSTEFYASPGVIAKGHARFCSKKCRLVFMGTFRGEKSWHWRGGGQVCGERRRAAEISANVGGGLTREAWEEICERFGRMCGWCRRPESERPLTIDHIIPLSKNGTHQPFNIQPLCFNCNARKGRKIIAFDPAGGSAFYCRDILAVMRAIGEGRLPLELSGGLNWDYLNERAGIEGLAFQIQELEVFNEGVER